MWHFNQEVYQNVKIFSDENNFYWKPVKLFLNVFFWQWINLRKSSLKTIPSINISFVYVVNFTFHSPQKKKWKKYERITVKFYPSQSCLVLMLKIRRNEMKRKTTTTQPKRRDLTLSFVWFWKIGAIANKKKRSPTTLVD